jgi:hypothetical protein
MRVNEKAYSGSTSYLMTAKHLRSVIGGGISGFSEFTPVCFPHREVVFTLMKAFLMGRELLLSNVHSLAMWRVY